MGVDFEFSVGRRAGIELAVRRMDNNGDAMVDREDFVHFMASGIVK
jgi:hypothetical protein